MNVSGGDIGNRFTVGTLVAGTSQFLAEGTVNVSGGQVGNDFRVGDHGIANISGGTFGSRFSAFDGSEVDITDEVFGDRFTANSGSVVEISSGSRTQCVVGVGVKRHDAAGQTTQGLVALGRDSA